MRAITNFPNSVYKGKMGREITAPVQESKTMRRSGPITSSHSNGKNCNSAHCMQPRRAEQRAREIIEMAASSETNRPFNSSHRVHLEFCCCSWIQPIPYSPFSPSCPSFLSSFLYHGTSTLGTLALAFIWSGLLLAYWIFLLTQSSGVTMQLTGRLIGATYVRLTVFCSQNLANYCIATRIVVGVSIAIPAASLCINRRLYKIASCQVTTITSALVSYCYIILGATQPNILCRNVVPLWWTSQLG